MSGTFCEGCGEGDLVADPTGAGERAVVCDLCGWKAPDLLALPRKWLADPEPFTKRDRKRAGKLFFLWLDLDPDAEDVAFDVMDVLELKGMGGTGARALIELERRPSEPTLERLRAVKGVRDVFLAP
jgi:hypothetical protein